MIKIFKQQNLNSQIEKKSNLVLIHLNVFKIIIFAIMMIIKIKIITLILKILMK